MATLQYKLNPIIPVCKTSSGLPNGLKSLLSVHHALKPSRPLQFPAWRASSPTDFLFRGSCPWLLPFSSAHPSLATWPLLLTSEADLPLAGEALSDPRWPVCISILTVALLLFSSPAT